MNFNPSSAAEHLDRAFRSGTKFIDLPINARPETVSEGYAAQEKFVELMAEPVVGWKIAGASPKGLRGETKNAPAIGAMVESRVHPSGAAIRLPSGSRATLETEVAFQFNRAVSPAEEKFDVSMIDRAFVTIEIVCSRYVDRKAVSQASFIADNLGFHTLICGNDLPFSRECDFDFESGIWRNGERIAHRLSDDDRTRPFESLAFLWRKFAIQNKMIPARSIVTTGILTVAVDSNTNEHLIARVADASAEVDLEFSTNPCV